MKKAIAFSFTVGSGKLSTMGKCLTRSIYQNVSNPEIHTFTTNKEYDEINQVDREFFETQTNLTVGESPISGYPISIKLEAMRRAAKNSDREYTLLLDTDTIVLNELESIINNSSDLYLRPAGGNHYWTMSESRGDWEKVYHAMGHEFPTTYHMPNDGKIPPYWNAGVVLTKSRDFPAKWLSMTKKIRDLDLPNLVYADQLSLSILSVEYDVSPVNKMYNFPIVGHFYCPSNVKVLHYFDFQVLCRCNNPLVTKKLRRAGVHKSPLYPPIGKRLRIKGGSIVRALSGELEVLTGV